jgi:hypothetical protein
MPTRVVILGWRRGPMRRPIPGCARLVYGWGRPPIPPRTPGRDREPIPERTRGWDREPIPERTRGWDREPIPERTRG